MLDIHGQSAILSMLQPVHANLLAMHQTPVLKYFQVHLANSKDVMAATHAIPCNASLSGAHHLLRTL